MKQIAIRENHLFLKAYSKGLKCSSHSITVYLLKDTHAKLLKKQNPQKVYINRVGITATKKIGGAVERNRAKRVIREAYRLVEKDFDIKKGNIIVIVAKSNCTKVKSNEVYSEMKESFGKLNILLLPREEAQP